MGADPRPPSAATLAQSREADLAAANTAAANTAAANDQRDFEQRLARWKEQNARRERDDPSETSPIASLPAAEPTPRATAVSTEQLLAARKRVQVSVYYTERCPHCTAARRFLVQNGIRFEGHDIERDRSARSRQRLLNPQGSVPTFDIDGQVLVGFNAERVASTIDRAAQRRLAR